MIRKIFKTIILSSSLVLTVTSCDLDQYPNDSISTETSWETVDDAVKFRNGIYSTSNLSMEEFIPILQTSSQIYLMQQSPILTVVEICIVGTLQLLNMMLKIFGNIIIIQLIIVIIL